MHTRISIYKKYASSLSYLFLMVDPLWLPKKRKKCENDATYFLNLNFLFSCFLKLLLVKQSMFLFTYCLLSHTKRKGKKKGFHRVIISNSVKWFQSQFVLKRIADNKKFFSHFEPENSVNL